VSQFSLAGPDPIKNFLLLLPIPDLDDLHAIQIAAIRVFYSPDGKAGRLSHTWLRRRLDTATSPYPRSSARMKTRFGGCSTLSEPHTAGVKNAKINTPKIGRSRHFT
jgi:hypothetical protein